jgi:hypothetical protein
MQACVGEPVSWLRLEQVAAGARDAAADAHLATCPACRACLDDIRGDVVALPPLPALAPRRAWWRLAIPALGALAVAAAILLLIRPAPESPRDVVPRDDVATVKGVGEVVVGTVRERAGAITDDAPTFRAGDRWKVVVTCPPAASAWLDVAVVDAAATAPDYPLAAVRVACGNRVVVPGAFELTGARANRVCAIATAGAPPPRGSLPATGAACVTIRPE